MKGRLPIVAALFAGVFLGLVGPANAVTPTYSNGFESNTDGWFTDFGGTITKQDNLYVNAGGYASGIESASGDSHARLERTAVFGPDDPRPACFTEDSGGGPKVRCQGPFTRWGGYGSTWYGGWTTQVDIYLDATYAHANADSEPGNPLLVSDPTNPYVKGTRFDYSSAVNNAQGNFIRDFGFNVATGPDLHGVEPPCSGFFVTAGMNVNRSGADAYDQGHDPTCIPDSGWYTFKHTFRENTSTGFLEVLMEIIPVDGTDPAATWTIQSPDPISSGDPSKDVGCNRYGWFTNQEIWGLPIDNASIDGGCTAPLVPVGKITPTGTTCQQYRDDTEATPVPQLGQLQYTVRGTKINAVSPGVFFYYTKVSGDATHRRVDITEENDVTSALDIPINQGQVVLYDATTCKVVKWKVDLGPEVGEATGTLPKDGDFIIGVKYNSSALKGALAPASSPVTYTFGAELEDVQFDEATILLVSKG
jgi:hypothetical protein